MRIQRVLNNNVIVARELSGKECVVIGKGVGFNKKANDLVDESCIQKIFRLDEENSLDKTSEAFNDVPEMLFNIVLDIVKQATSKLDRKIHKSVYASLLDHLSFALERTKQGAYIENMLLWDIKRLYRNEFIIGQWAINEISEKLHVKLPEDEAGFIALHLLNSQQDGAMPDIKAVSRVIQDILNIVKYHFKIEYEEDSINFQRFVTHLKFFAHRLLSNTYVTSDDSSLHDAVMLKYSSSYECAKRVNKFISRDYGRSLSDDEMMFLSIHIEHVRK
ncbi:beta-glucoside operon antiterminator [Pectobacterium atrosepticum SCRI1043]|uniref:Beta-glucoside operon antiterminator n=1 Tax=Pectobacterium atrosepticum (strain SCRI 1043 / ATCC BAA-672) TaxID=218491 RepID=Q6CYW6_PECAS|nr:PRD domain-containing protein [Pectobacterium atrosepticum]GKV87528.1 beta-1,4-xylanase [Pectobacterium carotovorum subsp. carotovorum]ATY92806.1 transcription antiterminator LicT [Pectobacterium atrosepticum]KFX13169.1 transcription antiterminator LicT [Pectobacterium atrosepticum]KMK82069.1 beta-glucoside operon antiterminator [Pectobacterium atrosepticum ICMP 1526]MBL0895744.1 PRD domain-containing protein [Pectobacterium atrosepticum]